MLEFESMVKQYPAHMRPFKELILKESLQWQILDSMFSSPFTDKLVLMGGTSIRIVHQSTRFSEDLDFDNRGLDENSFAELTRFIAKKLEARGYRVEMKNVCKSAYHCHLKFPGLLFSSSLSGYKTEKILIQVDMEPQDYDYSPEKHLLNKFGVFRYINTVPLPLLLSQKILAVLNRPRSKGRDFFDVVFLAGITRPDYDYLRDKKNLKEPRQLRKALIAHCHKLDFKELAIDVEPFLFEQDQVNRVTGFLEFLKSEDVFT